MACPLSTKIIVTFAILAVKSAFKVHELAVEDNMQRCAAVASESSASRGSPGGRAGRGGEMRGTRPAAAGSAREGKEEGGGRQGEGC